MNEKELKDATCQLLKVCARIPMINSVDHPDHTALPEAVGVYAIWEAANLMYVGYAGTSRRSRPTAICGLKDRIGSHWGGTLFSSSLALRIWLHRIAPTLEKEDHLEVASGGRDPSAETRAYIRHKLKYSIVVTANATDARALERYVHRAHTPTLNNL